MEKMINRYLGKLAWFAALCLSTSVTYGQIFDPVKWDFSVEQQDGSNQASLVLTATIEDGWHLYSQHLDDDGPIPTTFNFASSADYRLIGETEETTKPILEYDPNFEMDLLYFSKKAIFTQNIELLKAGPVTITGELEFMVCDEKQCLPPKLVDFSFTAEGVEMAESEEQDAEAVSSAQMGGQMLDPVKWEFSVDQEEGSDEADLVLTATIDDGWHLYSMNLPEGGPIATSFYFDTAYSFSFIGGVEETTKPTLEYDPNFEMELLYFSNKAVFTQRVKLLKEGPVSIKGELEFMACDDRQCITPKYVEYTFEAVGPKGAGSSSASARSMWTIFAIGFGGGLVALLMPCIFPMIPLTVSFFTKQSKTKSEGVRKAIIYGVSIVVIYVALGMLVTLITGDSSALNQLSTNPYFNILFFLLFVVFAISFFGAFEITLPSSWVNKADEASNRGGLMGIFFMAFTLSLVSFSCTGPIIGSLLVEAASKGEFFGPAIGMLGFSLALAIPFALFAAFPGWMNSLPKSGGWLNTVKVSLGFIELAFAFKFLSTADMAWQAGLLKRELFLALWIGIFLLLTIYLLGGFRMPNDSPTDKISVTRLMFAIVFGSFTLYLTPGLWGAPLHLISGFPPPQFYSEMPQGLSGGGGHIAAADIPKGADPEHCPHSLNCFHDFEEGLAHAKAVNKPVMLDFTGWGCVNCRKMEEQVWSDPRVLRRLRDEVVLVSLYVDERIKLPKEEQYYSEVLKSKVKTIGNKWSEFQAMHYQTNSQPYYVIIGHDSMEPLLPPTAYDPDIDLFIKWLDDGVKRFANE